MVFSCFMGSLNAEPLPCSEGSIGAPISVNDDVQDALSSSLLSAIGQGP